MIELALIPFFPIVVALLLRIEGRLTKVETQIQFIKGGLCGSNCTQEPIKTEGSAEKKAEKIIEQFSDQNR